MCSSDLIDRKEDQDNRRAKILSLTTGGEKFMNNLSVERVKTIEQSADLVADKVSVKIIENRKRVK